MALTNKHYDAILRQYSTRRLEARQLLDRRTEEVYNKCPEILDIDNRIAVQSVRRAKLALDGDRQALKGLAEDNRALAEEKKRLLLKYGFPAEYLTPHYDCPICRDTGFVEGRRCSCFKAALSELILSESNIFEAIKRENFSTFNTELYSDDPRLADPDNGGRTPRENIYSVLQAAHNFIDNFDNQFSNLLVYGRTGVGKTFLLNCIAGELLKSAHSVLYYTSFGFFDHIEKCKFRSGSSQDGSLSIDPLLQCDLLIIDDLGAEIDSQVTNYSLYSIINERGLRGRSTVISTNLDIRDLSLRYSERIFSRLEKDFGFLNIIGEDIRCM